MRIKKIILKTTGMAVMISMLFTNTYVQATEKTGNLSVMEEETVTPIPDSNEEDVVPTETPTPGTEEITPTPTPVPAEKGAPQILTLEAADNISNLEKMSPAFSSDIYEYHFLENGPEGSRRTMRATVGQDVLGRVNGGETEVNANGDCP